jgi:hypothetical protein
MNDTRKLFQAGTLAKFALMVVTLSGALSANAQTNTTSTQAIIQGIVNGASGVSTSATPAGVAASSSGTVLIPGSNGVRIPVPTSATASIPKTAIAAAARMCVGPWAAIGCTLTGAAALHELLNRPVGLGRYRACPDGTYGFVCKESNSTEHAPTSKSWWTGVGSPTKKYATSVAACKTYESTAGYNADGSRMTQYPLSYYPITVNAGAEGSFYGSTPCYWYRADNGQQISGQMNTTNKATETRCNDGTLPNTSKPLAQQCGVPAEVQPVEEQEVQQSLQEKMDEDFAANKRLYDALHADRRNAVASGTSMPETTNPVKETTPLEVSNPETSTLPVEKKRTVTTNPDGSQDTTIETEKQVVPATARPGTPGTPPLAPSTQIITTSITTNNVTNNTTSTETISPSPTITAPGEPIEIPDDYNREETQQKILTEITAESVTVPETPNVAEKMKETDDGIKEQFDALPSAQQTDKSNWFSWVWTPPVGICQASPTATVRGMAINFDGGSLWCDWVNKIRELMGFVFALFGAWFIYNLIFQRNE